MMTKTTVLIADEDSEYLETVKNLLVELNYEVFSKKDADQALLTLQQNNIDLLITNFQLGLINGNKLYKLAQAQYQTLPILITTHSSVISDSILTSHKGIFGFIQRPFNKQSIAQVIRNALTSKKRHNHQDWRNSILSCTPVMDELLDKAHHVAESNVNVVIQGEKGSGKKLLAQAIHTFLSNDEKPFIYIDCKSLDEDELYNQLLNNLNRKTKATIYLESIDKLASELQQALLTSLQSCQRAIAAAQEGENDLRIICACCDDLEEAMLNGYFDRQLFYLLNIITLNIPALRDRVQDIPLLARHFLAEHSLKHNRKVRNISPGALHLLAKANWPGNVSQLNNLIKQVVIDSNGPVISEKTIAAVINDDHSTILSFNQARANFERDYLIKVLQVTEGNVTHAARIAQRNRTDFYKLLSKNEISPNAFKPKSSGIRPKKQDEKLWG